MPGKRSYRRSSRPRGGKYSWWNFDIDEVTITQNSQATSDLLAAVSNTVLVGSSIARILGVWGLRPSASDVLVVVKAAIHLMSGDAFAQGSNPELQNDEYHPLWVDTAHIVQGNLLDATQTYERPVETKARRKIREQDERLVFQFENISPAANNGLVHFNIRVLLFTP